MAAGWMRLMFLLWHGDSAISQIQAGTIDFYSFNLASDVFPAIKEAGLPSPHNPWAVITVSV